MAAWLGRGSVVAACAALLTIGGACGDDDSSSSPSNDAGIDQRIVNPPPPPPPGRDAAEPPEGVDTTGRLGPAQVVADLGASTDGPSWSPIDGALYFTMPGNASPLRRLLPGGQPETVAAIDGGANGTANGDSRKLFVTDPNGIVMLDLSDAGPPTNPSRRSGSFGLLADIAATKTLDASVNAYVVDVTASRAYVFDPNGGVNEFRRFFDTDGGTKVTSIAIGKEGPYSRAYVAHSNDATGVVSIVDVSNAAGSFKFPVLEQIPLPGTPPNGIAVDESGTLFVAWARGIDVFLPGQERAGSSPGLALKAVPTSLTFGGADRRTLYVTTAAGKIYAIPTGTPGILR